MGERAQGKKFVSGYVDNGKLFLTRSDNRSFELPRFLIAPGYLTPNGELTYDMTFTEEGS